MVIAIKNVKTIQNVAMSKPLHWTRDLNRPTTYRYVTVGEKAAENLSSLCPPGALKYLYHYKRHQQK